MPFVIVNRELFGMPRWLKGAVFFCGAGFAHHDPGRENGEKVRTNGRNGRCFGNAHRDGGSLSAGVTQREVRLPSEEVMP